MATKNGGKIPVVSPVELKDMIVAYLINNLPLLVIGPPGCGKTEITHQSVDLLASMRESLGELWRLLVTHPVVDMPSDWKGHPWGIECERTPHTPDGYKALHLAYGNLARMLHVPDGERLCVFLDDLPQAIAQVQGPIMHLIRAGRIGDHNIDPKCAFVAAGNRHYDMAGSHSLISPLKDRFVTIVELRQNVSDWTDYYFTLGLPMSVAAYVNYRPEILTSWEPSKDMSRTATARSLVQAAQIVVMAEAYNWAPGFMMRQLAGCVGDATAGEFTGFYKIHKTLPDMDALVKDPQKHIDANADVAVCWAICTAVADRAQRMNDWSRLVKVANTFDEKGRGECSAFIGKRLAGIDTQKLGASGTEFSKWVKRHKDLLVG